MIKRLIPALCFLAIIAFAAASTVFATSGACLENDGINCAAGPDLDGSLLCNDGMASATMYRDMRNECAEDFVPFTDLDDTHENYEAIINLYENNVISGYPDHTFQAENKVNRAEFLKILIEGDGITPDPLDYNNCFPDVTTEWYANYVCLAKEEGWIEGYPDGEFKPENQIAFVEALKMLIEIHDYADELGPAEDSDYWYIPYGELAVEKDFVTYASPPYNPLEYQSRAQIAEMTNRSFVLKSTMEVETEPVDEFSMPLEPSFNENDIYIGELGAPVTIFEFTDYQCPFCKKLHDESFDQLKTNYIDTGDVLYVVKDFPLSMHENAEAAALAARCANEQDAYWEFRDILFAKQSEWDGLNDPLPAFGKYIENLQIRSAGFQTCIRNEEFMDEITADFEEGQILGVQGTPTLIINGEVFVGAQPYEDIANFIDEILYN